MSDRNPYSIGFGQIPYAYIEQTDIVDKILEDFEDDFSQHSCYMLSGIRGSGKTVIMVTITEKLKSKENWIVVRLNPESELIEELAAKLYDSHKFITSFVNTEINLSKFGIGISAKSVSPAASIESAIEKILNRVKQQNMKVLVAIDEVSNTPQLRKLAHAFQTFVGENLPIYLIMTGLYSNIKDLKNVDTNTFLYRAEEIEVHPLNPTLMQETYIKTLNISQELGWDLAILTKGYPVAYQIAGKYMWESSDRNISPEFIKHFDNALARYCYDKIWSELSDKDKYFLSFICQKDSMSVSEILEESKQKKNEFSQYRARLIEKGIIKSVSYGKVTCTLPRFGEYIKTQNSYNLY